jgi:hypothetical protein
LIIGIGTDPAIKPRNRLSVVIKDVRLRIEHGVERIFIAVEIGDQDFYFAFRIKCADLANRLGPVGGAPSGKSSRFTEVITV